MTEGTIRATSTTMAGHTSDSDPALAQNPVFTTSIFDTDWENGTSRTQGLPSSNLQDEFTPAMALESGLNLDFLVGLPDFSVDPDLMEWEGYYPSMVDGNAPKASPRLNDFDDEDPDDKSPEPGFGAPAAQPESDHLLGLPYNSHYEPASAAAQEPNPACEDFIDPAKLLVHNVKDFSDSSEILNSRSCDLNDFLPRDFELPDTPPRLDFLQGLRLIPRELEPAEIPDIGYNTQELPHTTGNTANQTYECSASRVALAASSEPKSKNEARAQLTDQRRAFNGHQGLSNQRRPESRIRIQRNKNYGENSAYTPLNEAPKPWDIFEYTKDGELDPSRLFSAEEITRFLFTHPLHQGHYNLKNSPLKLRVHRTPASSAKRFPNGLFCRFKDCPMRTIGQGQKLVVVDELSVHHPDHDLFLNAFYVHLWCFESFCDFPEVCANFDVTAKGREARKEVRRKNRFQLSCEEEKVVEDFVACCAKDGRGSWVARCPEQQTIGCPHYEPQSPPYNGTLCHQLNVTKLHYGGQGRINLRKDREEKAGYHGANITRHLGDLSKEAQLREFSRTHKNQNQLKPNPKTERHYRTDGDDVEEERQPEIHPQQTHQPPAVVDSYQPHGAKRNRDECNDGQNLDHEAVQAHKTSMHLDFKIPIWKQLKRDDLGTEWFDRSQDTVGGTPGISTRTALTPKPNQTRSQLQVTAASPVNDGRSASISGLPSMESEDDSEQEIELAMIAAQRQRRLLEIEDAKDKEKECRIRKVKLQKAIEKKRARKEEEDNDGYGPEVRGKRQRKW